MANIKSAKKRILVNQTKYERNKSVKSAVKTEESIKKGIMDENIGVEMLLVKYSRKAW